MMPVAPLSHSLRRPRRGQALVFLALVMIVLIGGLGLALDGGFNFAQRRAMQNAADAAALAGAKALSINDVSTMPVRTTVQTVAGRNGIANPTNSAELTCVYLNNSLQPLKMTDGSDMPCGDNLPTGGNFPPGINVSAVRVTVTETHTTFVMRALGIRTSSTSATATAQVQVLNSLPNSQVAFIICGINAVKVDADGNPIRSGGNPVTIDLLETLTTPGLIFSGDSTTYKVTNEPAKIADSAYAIDWKLNPTLPDYNLSPRFKIHDNSGNPEAFARCTAPTSFMGFNGRTLGSIEIVDNALHMQCTTPICTPTSTTPWQYTSGNTGQADGGPWTASCDFCGSTTFGPVYNSTGDATLRRGGLSQTLQGNAAGLAARVSGAGGCPTTSDQATIGNCVMILPIADNSVKGGNGANAVLAVRAFAAVYITKNNNGTEHYGQLIKNYPVSLAGTPTWTTGSSGVQVIRLVR
jgi:Flp pilus assembly protein TadG